MRNIQFKAKFLGAMLGSALGDAIGELAVRYSTKGLLLESLAASEELVYTDDTAMALGLAESLLEKGTLDQQHLGETFHHNLEREPWRGYAMGPPTIFSLVRSTRISYPEAARTLFGGAGSFGNGSAMRVAPVGLFFHASAHLYAKAAASAEVTHAHVVGKDGAAVQAQAVAMALKLDPMKAFPLASFVNELVVTARTPVIRGKMQLVRSMLEEHATDEVAAQRLGRSVMMDESMPFAIYSFLCYPQSFEQCLFCAVLNGGDRDTLGAMACAVSGAYLGVEAIPDVWTEKLENRREIERLASALADRRQNIDQH